MHHYISLLLLSIFTPSSLAGISYINDRSSDPNKRLVNCLPIKECKVLYGTKPSHFSIYGFVSYHQFDCLPEEGNALCVVSANFEGLQILPCVPRDKCALLYGVKNTHFVTFGHQPICQDRSFVRCVESKEEDSSMPSSNPTTTPCSTTMKPTTKPITTGSNNYPPVMVTTTHTPQPTAESMTHAPIVMINKPTPYPAIKPITSMPVTTAIIPSPPIIKPILQESLNLPQDILSFPFPTGGHGQINVHAPNAHHWSINPSTSVEIHGAKPTYLTWGRTMGDSIRPTKKLAKALKGRSRQHNLYNYLTNTN